jgi:hypothetical protein
MKEEPQEQPESKIMEDKQVKERQTRADSYMNGYAEGKFFTHVASEQQSNSRLHNQALTVRIP